MSYFLLRAFLKFAAAKRRIEQFNLGDDKILQYFINRYDHAVAWNGYEMPVLDAENNPVLDENGQPTYDTKKIENKEDINQFIHDVLLDDLYSLTDPQSAKNVYIKKLNMDKLRKVFPQQLNPAFDEAYDIYLNNPEEGMKKYVNHVNNLKMLAFKRWVGYIKGNERLKKEAAFCFILLNRVVDSSSSSTLNPPTACNPVVIGNLRASLLKHEDEFKGNLRTTYEGAENEEYEIETPSEEPTTESPIGEDAAIEEAPTQKKKIDRNTKNADIQKQILSWDKSQSTEKQKKETLDEIAARLDVKIDDIKEFLRWEYMRTGAFVKIYQELLTEHNEKIAKMSSAAGKGWIKFPQKDTIQDEVDENGNKITAEEIYDRNLDYLDALSQPIRWCTTRNFNGPYYTSQGDFYAFVRNGKAECAIRFVGDSLVEFAGDQTAGYWKCPTSNYKEIIPFVRENGWEDKIAPVKLARDFWEKIVQESKLNLDFFDSDGNPNLEEIENYLTFIRKDPRNFNRVDISLFNAFPDVMQMFKDACKEGWLSEFRKTSDSQSLANIDNLASWGKDIPDFVQEDPAFVEGLHGRVSSIYADNPLRIREVMNKLPLHWQIYPQGKEIFKQAVLNSYDNDFYWVSKAYGVKRRAASERLEIERAQNYINGLNSVISEYYPDLLQDDEFQSMIDSKKQDNISDAIMRGFISDEMDLDRVDQTFANQEFAEQFIETLATKIATAHERPNTRITEDKVFAKKFMMDEIFKVAPKSLRNLPNFSSMMEKIVMSVLAKKISYYKMFDPEFKLPKSKDGDDSKISNLQRQIYDLYKAKVLASHPQELYLNHGPRYFDDAILDDPEFQSAISPTEDASNITKYIENIKYVPESYLQLIRVDPVAAQHPEVVDAYINSRLRRGMLKRQSIIFEFKLLPAFVKDMPEVRNAYEEVVIHLLKTSLPKTKYYIDCKDIDEISMQNPIIKQLCEERESKNKNTRTANGWYIRSKRSLWGSIGI
jgi:hypothetical protein